ncbi:hypothetical protein CTAYLR_001467 [Chrysophaeum taylorii]|uniref:Uncharacterized protein n=1 Tax=Chrysophaeum taylorii TaxID=2483200 RepID=A0AAD7XIB0_9STRA|nr:hypothetical protein CTAYLR_001467 [Chrysophaeum taylorii]
MQWYLACDRNHQVLAARLEAALEDDDSSLFEPRVFRVEDLRGLPGRAAGGLAVQDFKLACIDRALGENPEGSYIVWSDADVQPLAPLSELRAAIERESATQMDVYAQREFEDVGVNVGFLVLRVTETTRTLFAKVRRTMTETRALDQKVLNRMLVAGEATVARLPSSFWASSNATARPTLDSLVLHHANFVPGDARSDARDPTPKLDQLDAVAAMRRANNAPVWDAFLDRLATDPTLHQYRDRHFPLVDRPRWGDLP